VPSRAPDPYADTLRFHDNFEDHQAAGGRIVVTTGEAVELWESEPTMVPNRKSQRAQFLMVGRIASGRDITVALVGERNDLWTAWTAWDTS
jgi:hypothetical protein